MNYSSDVYHSILCYLFQTHIRRKTRLLTADGWIIGRADRQTQTVEIHDCLCDGIAGCADQVAGGPVVEEVVVSPEKGDSFDSSCGSHYSMIIYSSLFCETVLPNHRL